MTAEPILQHTAAAGRGRALRSTGLLRTLFALAVTGIFILPIYLVLANAFKTSGAIFAHPGSLPIPPTTANLSTVLNRPDHLFWSGLINSVQVTALSVVGSTVVAAMLAHYLVRARTRTATAITVLVVIGLTIPSAVTLQPITQILLRLHLMTTVPGLILVNIAANLPFATLLFMGFIKGIPAELEEAAAIDGAGPLRAFWLIVFPLLRPAAASAAIFIAVTVWNDFITPLIILGPANGTTVTVGMYRQVSEHVSDFGAVFGYMVLATVPILILFLFFQRYFVKGLLGGATKG